MICCLRWGRWRWWWLQDGRLLTIQRQDNHAWGFPAGFCDLGENVAQTAVRETFEEQGLHIALERLLGVYSGRDLRHTYVNGDQVQNVGAVFRARVVGGQTETGAGRKRAALRWQTPDEFLAEMTPSTWRASLPCCANI